MNWILLILAGCLELVFTFCLGKINRVFGMEKYVWSFVLLVSLCVSMLLLIKGDQDIAGWYGLCDMDRHRCGGHGINRYFLL